MPGLQSVGSKFGSSLTGSSVACLVFPSHYFSFRYGLAGSKMKAEMWLKGKTCNDLTDWKPTLSPTKNCVLI